MTQPTEVAEVTVGDIVVSRSWLVTPAGARPLAGLRWTVTPQVHTTRKVPAWAVVMTVVTVWLFLLGLLFLLVKEERTEGAVHVTVEGDGFFHSAAIPVNSLYQVQQITVQVNHARSLTAAAA